MCPYTPSDDLTKERITVSGGGPSPPPSSSNDFYSDETINAIPVPPATLSLSFGFSSVAVMITNLSGGAIYCSFDGGVTFHRVSAGYSKAFDTKGATSLVLLGTAGGEAYEVDVW